MFTDSHIYLVQAELWTGVVVLKTSPQCNDNLFLELKLIGITDQAILYISLLNFMILLVSQYHNHLLLNITPCKLFTFN